MSIQPFPLLRPLPHRARHRKGLAALGHCELARSFPRVSIAWRPEQFDAINRRVVRNNSTFADEARRLMDIALRLDHIE